MAAEQRADVADDAGLIVVLDDEQRAFERRLDADAVHQHQARAAVREHRAFDPAIAVARVQLHRDQARVIARAGAARLDQLDAALGGNGTRVDRRDAAGRQDGAEHAFKDRAAEQLVALARQLAVVADADGVDPRLSHLRDHQSQMLARASR